MSNYSRFQDLGIPMVEELTSTNNHKDKKTRNENVLAKYTKLMESGNAIQFVPQIVGPDGSLRRTEGGYEIVLPPDQIYEGQVVTAEISSRHIGRHYTCEVVGIEGDVITVSHTKALYGDGSPKEKAVRRIRAVSAEVLRKMKPHTEELMKRAEASTAEYIKKRKEDGAAYTESAIKNITIQRYHDLYEKKKDELGIERCIVPATVEEVQVYRVVLNLFNLDIMGVCSRASWSRGNKNVDLREQVHVGDVVDVEVLSFNPEAKTSNIRVQGVWICSRKNVADRMDEKSFQRATLPYEVGSTVQVICERLGSGNGVKRWIGHIKGTDIKVAAKYGARNIGVFVGGTYVVRITGRSDAQLMLEGRTKGFVMKSGGVYIPKKPGGKKETSAEQNDEDFFSEETLADSFMEIEKPVTVSEEAPVSAPPVAEEPKEAPLVDLGEMLKPQEPKVEDIVAVPTVKTDW